ncbi:TetR/AcrR family transcriptional regulator [Polymorphospora rubra]|uniref:TetR family transcriptional regulator n=1 Tax=Polymorphospora rubra TaxID=338584 RepID=A0A810N5B2_9ACTN|nr:TetR/AcrR family transcriptional regulator [Polymorphospora rubra]BCJ68586.1 TetR family transcriptional regulator [Polymorphospora rubra]
MVDRAGTGARAGRPRDAHLDAAILDSTMAVLGKVGYKHLTIGEVATRAGTTKPALYRRWASQQELVLAALARQLGGIEAPDTDCTLCDLHESISVFVDAFHRLPPNVLAPLLADCAGHDDLRTAFMTTLFEPPRAAVRQTLRGAIARGDLRPDLNLDLAVDLLASLVYYRALFGHAPLTGADIGDAVETLLRGIAVDYDTLLAHSLAQSSPSAAHGRHEPHA